MLRTERHILPRSLGSHPVSSAFRKMFEIRHIRAVMGGLLASMSMAAGMFISLPDINKVEAMTNTVEVNVETEKVKISPLPEATGISQDFYILHPGIDITAPLGSKIYPVAAGKVETVGIERQGYGRHVVIKHEDGTISLYAHMGKIEVQEGEEVSKKTELGEVGVTGHTTGPHLHLEVHVNGYAVNPIKYLD